MCHWQPKPWVVWIGLTANRQSQTASTRKESADKPGSVEDNHSSGIRVAVYLKRPTRKPMWATCATHVRRHGRRASLFDLAPGGVCRAVECYHRRGALLPHPFTLTGPACAGLRRFAFCCTVRGLTSPRRYLAPCPRSPDFPPRLRAAIAWPTPARMVGTRAQRCKLISASARTSLGRELDSALI